MSSESKLNIFIHLLITTPLTPVEQAELKSLINNPALPDAPDPILTVIEEWLSHETPTRRVLLAKYIEQIQSPETSRTLGPGGISVRGAGGITPPPNLSNRTIKELLNNALLAKSTDQPPQDPKREQS